ncbi:ABC transporter permease [uncultured Veillonella sp.]|uniref:ABC transporter permease n=1 Tax=uncultured Veillonella sp. TaxID=159268 RepID=UPI0025D92C22|nr:ABC transporter permease [uncultured Veillonella sp.]MDY3973088.1 ABC transporter permease [Veillonella caviae]
MTESISMELTGFFSTYILLLIVGAVFKYCGIDQTKYLIFGSIQMSVQLIIAGYVLLYIFQSPSPIFTLAYLTLMIGFAIYRTLNRSPWLNRRFQWIVGFAVFLTCVLISAFMLLVVIRKDALVPQYVIPITGMLVSATMNGATLALKAFKEALDSNRHQIEVLLNIGAHPRKILHPFINQSLETAFLPTMNSMVGMGITALPGMMTGQILAGALPNEAVLYQSTIMIANCSCVCLASFGLLYFGSRTLYNKRKQINTL